MSLKIKNLREVYGEIKNTQIPDSLRESLGLSGATPPSGIIENTPFNEKHEKTTTRYLTRTGAIFSAEAVLAYLELPLEKRREIDKRLIERYYEFRIGQSELLAFVEAPHGAQPERQVKDWCREHNIVSFETGTEEIVKSFSNHGFFKHPRLLTDVNARVWGDDDKGGLFNNISERKVRTMEPNLWAQIAQYKMMEWHLRDQNLLDGSGKVTKPFLYFAIHGKKEAEGQYGDIEIAARSFDGQAPVDMETANWLAGELKDSFEEKEFRGPVVNVRSVKGEKYSGTGSLNNLVHGGLGGILPGFGKNFKAVQIELSPRLRAPSKRHLAALALKEVAEKFQEENVDF